MISRGVIFPSVRSCRPAPVIALCLVLGASSCTYHTDIPTSQVEQAQRPALQESWEVVLRISDAGTQRIQLEAWHMERYDDPDSLFTLLDSNPDVPDDRVRATFYDSAGVSSGTLTAESVRFDEDGEQLNASGDVRVRSSSGRLLEAELVRWDQAARRITAPGFVYLETEDEKIRGFGLDADEDLSSYAIRRITGTVVIREDTE